FDSNRDRMRYPEFRQQNLFVGSGVIEAGCKTVIGSRLKQSGMFWTVRGANAIIALRCCCASGKFEAYWEDRAA
ncbi:MAG TPA: ISKra4 family transposase, partial [Bryobacteraceae bacterium]|nr:ISKra4 family transposase [Bryobacteraceae bacterium]